MKRIALTQGKVAFVDDDLYGKLSQFKWHTRQGIKTFYAQRNIQLPNGRRRALRMHQEIFQLKGEPVPKKVDHRDRDGLNNQWDNLRPATSSESNRNRGRHTNNTSGYIGVSWHKANEKWMASARVNLKRKHLGYFDDPAEAARARDKFVKKHHGRFAVLNFGVAL